MCNAGVDEVIDLSQSLAFKSCNLGNFFVLFDEGEDVVALGTSVTVNCELGILNVYAVAGDAACATTAAHSADIECRDTINLSGAIERANIGSDLRNALLGCFPIVRAEGYLAAD